MQISDAGAEAARKLGNDGLSRNQHVLHSHKTEQADEVEEVGLLREPLTHRVVSNRAEHLQPLKQSSEALPLSHRNGDDTAKKSCKQVRLSELPQGLSLNAKKKSLQSDSIPKLMSKVVGHAQTDKKKNNGLSRNLQRDNADQWRDSKEDKLKKLNEELSDLKKFMSNIGQRDAEQPTDEAEGGRMVRNMDKKLNELKAKHQNLQKRRLPKSKGKRSTSRQSKKLAGQQMSEYSYSKSAVDNVIDGEADDTDSGSWSDRKIHGILRYCQEKYGNEIKAENKAQNEKYLKERPWRNKMKKAGQKDHNRPESKKNQNSDMPLQ